MHERSSRQIASDGLLSPWLTVFERIRTRLNKSSQCEDVIHYFTRMMKFDYSGISIKMKIYVDGRARWANIRFHDFYMTSGWRFTSTINFLVETVATHTTLGTNVLSFYEKLGSLPNGECIMQKFTFISWRRTQFHMSTRTGPGFRVEGLGFMRDQGSRTLQPAAVIRG